MYVIITLQEIKDWLGILGVELMLPNDDLIIDECIRKVTNNIKNETNQNGIPVGAREIAIEMIVAEYLFIKFATGTLNIDTINFNVSSVKSVKDGDTTVDYGDSKNSPTDRFTLWLNSMFHRNYDWSTWRRMRW